MLSSGFQKGCLFRLAVLLISSLFLVQQIILVPPLFAQTSAREWLRLGVQQCENAEFESAIKSLEQAIAKGVTDKEEVIQAYKYLAFSAAALGDEAKAEGAYVELLKRYPIFDLLLSDSPRLRKPFNQAREKVDLWRQQPPVIECTPPATAAKSQALEVVARITANSGVDSAVVYYKKAGEGVYQQQSMHLRGENLYGATLPAATNPAEWAFYIAARARNGRTAEWRSAAVPQLVAIDAPVKKSRKWLLFTAGALLLAGGGAAAALAGGEDSGSPTTPGSSRLPDPPGTP